MFFSCPLQQAPRSHADKERTELQNIPVFAGVTVRRYIHGTKLNLQISSLIIFTNMSEVERMLSSIVFSFISRKRVLSHLLCLIIKSGPDSE